MRKDGTTMNAGTIHKEQAIPRVAVVGSGYWGKNLVRNFHDLQALAAICDNIPVAGPSLPT